MYLECRNKCTMPDNQANMEWSGPHIKASCPVCGSFIKFVKQDRIDHGDMRKLQEWQQEQVEDEEQWVTATFRDGSEEQIGEVTFDSSNPPIELEIDGVTYVAQF